MEYIVNFKQAPRGDELCDLDGYGDYKAYQSDLFRLISLSEAERCKDAERKEHDGICYDVKKQRLISLYKLRDLPERRFYSVSVSGLPVQQCYGKYSIAIRYRQKPQ